MALFMNVLKATIACTMILLSYIVYNIKGFMQTDLAIPKLNDDACHKILIDGNGPEDIAFFNEKYLITATSFMHEIWHYNKTQELVPSGEIFLINALTEHTIKLTKLKYPANVKFHAHGIYVKGEILYVINHAYKFGGERIDVFRINAELLEALYIKSFEFPELYYGLLNDIVVLNDEEESFFVTTWSIFPHSSEGPSKFKNILNFILAGGIKLKQTYIYSCSFKSGSCQKLENTKGIMNNGLTIKYDDDHTPTLYAADSFGKTVSSYSIKKEKKSELYDLTKIDEYKFDHMLENLVYSQFDNAIYVTLVGRGSEYPQLTDFMDTHHRLPTSEEFKGHSGSAKLDLKSGEITYLNFNTKIITASVALKKNNKIFYGSWCDSGIVVCIA